MTDNDMPEYAIDATNSLRYDMPECAIVHAVLGVAYEQRTANLLALDHMPGLKQQAGTLTGGGEELLLQTSEQVLERLGFKAPVEGQP